VIRADAETHPDELSVSGDIVLLTVAVRDLHLPHPGRHVTGERTSAGALWERNPYVTGLQEEDTGVRSVDCAYPAIHQASEPPCDFIHVLRKQLQVELGVPIEATRFGGEIHLSADGRAWTSQVEEARRIGTRVWLIIAGVKLDFTTKWWPTHRFKRVVEVLRDEFLLVQTGERGHHHPRLDGVLDLPGQTDLWQLVRLVHHADRVVCAVTLAMHLAAAMETKPCQVLIGPCGVIVGGREPQHWEAYTGTIFSTQWFCYHAAPPGDAGVRVRCRSATETRWTVRRTSAATFGKASKPVCA
jgi:hypothetical protein